MALLVQEGDDKWVYSRFETYSSTYLDLLKIGQKLGWSLCEQMHTFTLFQRCVNFAVQYGEQAQTTVTTGFYANNRDLVEFASEIKHSAK